MIVKILLLFRMNGKKLVVTVKVLCCNWILEANSIQLLKMASLCSFFYQRNIKCLHYCTKMTVQEYTILPYDLKSG